MAKYAIELFFDAEMEKKLLTYPKMLSVEKLSSRYLQWHARPHITLACFNDVDEGECIARIRQFALRHEKLPAHIGSLGMFTGTKTIFAAPIMTAAMYRLQNELHTLMQGFDTAGHEWYLPDRWVPHCALALMGDDEPEAFYRACDLLLHKFENVNGMFSAIGLVRITFPAEEIFITELQGGVT